MIGNKKKTCYEGSQKNKKIIICVVISILIVTSGASIMLKSFKGMLENDKILANSNNLNIKKCPYTLDEIYEAIQSNKLFSTSIYDEESHNLSYVIMHFYDYFNKDTNFLVAKSVNEELIPISFREMSFEEYEEAVSEYFEVFLREDIIKDFPNNYSYAAKGLIRDSGLENIK